MKKLVLNFVFFAALAAGTSLAHASSITYTFTTSPGDSVAGTSFTYVNPAGFLAFDTGVLVPTTAGDLYIFGTDYGLLTGFDFISPLEIKLFNNFGSLVLGVGSPYQISALTPGEHIPFLGTLAITNTAAAAPEPSSLVLLGTGVLGAIGAVRRRMPTGCVA